MTDKILISDGFCPTKLMKDAKQLSKLLPKGFVRGTNAVEAVEDVFNLINTIKEENPLMEVIVFVDKLEELSDDKSNNDSEKYTETVDLLVKEFNNNMLDYYHLRAKKILLN